MTSLLSGILSNLNLPSILIGLIVFLIVYKLSQKLKYKEPPGPFGWPLIGNLDVIKAKFMHKRFFEYKKRYGPIFQVSLGPVKVVVLNDIKVVTEALISRKADFANRPQNFSGTLLTEGGKDIALANYTSTWKLHRLIAGKALRKYMAGNKLQEVVHNSMRNCLDKMADEKRAFNPDKYIDYAVFNILNSVVFGKSVTIDDPSFVHFMELDKEFNAIFGKGLFEDVLPWFAKIWPSKKLLRLKELLDDIMDILRCKFKEHKETFDPENLRDFTDALIFARMEAEEEENHEIVSKLTDVYLIQTLKDIYFAGIDTSRLTLYFAIHYMAQYQDIQRKVQEEIDTVVGTDRLPDLKDREHLAYGEAVLHEAMRLSSVVPLALPHVTMCDTKVAGYDIPKDTMVIINTWALHHDSSYWKDVFKFDPTRYIDETGKLAMKPESWLPFSMGRRVCLGEPIAKPELHMIFTSILHRFTVSLAEGTKPEIELTGSSFTLEPKSFQITIKERSVDM